MRIISKLIIMKRTLFIAALTLLLASCSIHKASVASTAVYSPAVETATIASLDVVKQKINYVYYPTKKDSKSLSEKQLIQNAIYKALEQNGNADELVEVNYYITIRRGFLSKRVESISLSGYPAYYRDFREPGEVDLEAVETFSRSKMYRQSKLQQLSTGVE